MYDTLLDAGVSRPPRFLSAAKTKTASEAPLVTMEGTVKWYKPDKGFRFYHPGKMG
jgi:hypothetical protein